MYLWGCHTLFMPMGWKGKDGWLLGADFQDNAMTPLQGIRRKMKKQGQSCSPKTSWGKKKNSLAMIISRSFKCLFIFPLLSSNYLEQTNPRRHYFTVCTSLWSLSGGLRGMHGNPQVWLFFSIGKHIFPSFHVSLINWLIMDILWCSSVDCHCWGSERGKLWYTVELETVRTRMWPSPKARTFRRAEEEEPAGSGWSWSWEEKEPPRRTKEEGRKHLPLAFLPSSSLTPLTPHSAISFP